MQFFHVLKTGATALLGVTLFTFAGCGGDDEPESPSGAGNGGSKTPPGGSGSDPGAAVAAPHPEPTDDLSKAVENFTGGHTKLVWSAHQNKKSADTYASGKSHYLAGMDTRDGKGVRFILEERSNYARPMVTPDGSSVIYTFNDITKKGNTKHYDPSVWQVGWDGSGKRELGKGYASDVWRDPEGRDWIYAVRDIAPSSRAQIEAKEMVRFPLDAPEQVEVVWKRTKLSADNTQLSRDGKRASGLFPWPEVGVMDLEKGTWKKLETGCWPSHVPDDSAVSWVFDGGHHIVTMFRGAKRWTVPLNNDPELKGSEVYHPRWSNHPRYFALTEPYKSSRPGNGISSGGLGAEVYLAKFSPDLTAVESYLKITDNKTGDFFPDLWISGGENVSLDLPPLDPQDDAPVVANEGVGWPGEGAAFGWFDLRSENEIPAGDTTRACKLILKGFARYGRNSDILLDGGSFIPDVDSAAAIGTAITGDVISFAALFTADTSPGDVLLLRTPELVIQRGDETGAVVVYRRLGDGTKYHRAVFPGALPSNSARHLAVVSAPDAATLTIDGATLNPSVSDSVELPPAFSQPGVEFGGGTGGGGIAQVALLGRGLTEEGIGALAEKAAASVAARVPAPARIRLRAKLVETDPVPTNEWLQAYREGLLTALYEVEEVLDGEFAGNQILVRQWGNMDRKPVPGMPREVGKSYELVVEEWNAHPELKGMRVLETIDIPFDVIPYYDVTTPGK